MKKVLECRCCNEEIKQEDLAECFINGKDIFCSMSCCAKWSGGPLDEVYQDHEDNVVYQEILNDYGIVIVET